MFVNIHAARTNLPRLVERAAAGEEIVIGEPGRPMARLVPYTGARRRRRPGRWAGRVTVAGDFDATSGGLLDAFEGR